MAALYDGDGNRLFTMDYTGICSTPEELASLVSPKAQNHYTITKYVNDIARENEEVLTELDVRGNVTSSYTYGTMVNLRTCLLVCSI